jgi:hypothetical protein
LTRQEISTAAAPPRRLGTRAQRALRDERILERMQGGWDYEGIARTQALSVRRVRFIVAQAMKSRRADPNSDHARLQRLRLGPSLRLAAEAVASGDLRGIDRLLRLLDRLDRYNSTAVSIQADDVETLNLLRERINRAARINDERREEEERAHRNALARLAALGVSEQDAIADLAPPGEAAPENESEAPEAGDEVDESWKKWLTPDNALND